MDTFPFTAGVETTDTFDIWRRKTNAIITKISSGSSGANPDDGYPTWTIAGDFTINGTGTLNAKDIYCRNIYSGSGTSTGDSVIELGHLRTDNGKAILDFHTRAGSDFDARIKKEGTINGQFSFENNGTGTFLFDQANIAAPFIFSHAQNESLKITNDGVSIGTLSQPKTLTVEGNITASGEIKNQNIALSGNQINAIPLNGLALSYQARDGAFATAYNTIIYDGKRAAIVSITGTTKEVTFANKITASGAVSGTSLIATSSGTITGGALTCTSLNTTAGTVTCGDITSSGNITSSTGAISGASLSAGTGNITCGNLTSSVGTISGIKITSTGEISGSTLRTDSSLTFTAGTGNGSTDVVTIERVNPANDVSDLRVTIGDNESGAAVDSFLIGINTTGLPAGWVEKFRVTSSGNVTAAGSIKANGDIVAYNSSDSRLKENVKVIPDALSKVSQLSGVTFDWNDQQTLYSGNDVGVIAQEVEAVLPQIVTTRADGYKAVKYERLVALLIESVKELKANNEQLQLRIYSLEQHINI